MTTTNKSSDRYPLLLYRRTMDRVWILTLLLGLLSIAVWKWTLVNETIILGISSDIWLLVAGVVSLVLSAFAFLAKRAAT